MSDALIITRGDDRVFSVHALDANNQAADLTDVWLWFTAKVSLGDADDEAILRKTSDQGITVVGPPSDGVAEVTIASSDTNLLVDSAQGKLLFWDLQSRDQSGKIATLASGSMVVKADVTRAIS